MVDLLEWDLRILQRLIKKSPYATHIPWDGTIQDLLKSSHSGFTNRFDTACQALWEDWSGDPDLLVVHDSLQKELFNLYFGNSIVGYGKVTRVPVIGNNITGTTININYNPHIDPKVALLLTTQTPLPCINLPNLNTILPCWPLAIFE